MPEELKITTKGVRKVMKRLNKLSQDYKLRIPGLFSRDWAKDVSREAKKEAPSLTGTLKKTISPVRVKNKQWRVTAGKPRGGQPNKAYARPYAQAVEFGAAPTDALIYMWQHDAWRWGRKGIAPRPFLRPAIMRVLKKGAPTARKRMRKVISRNLI